MPYVDGFVIPIKKKNLPAYWRIAKKASKIWREYGCLEYRECLGDDLANSWGVPFPKMAKTKSDETVVFSYVVYKNKAQRDRANAKIMKDPRILAMCDPKNSPFDPKRMAYGGFKVMVSS
jgi:uncharacterized protein YbaA (DUF1428 family)